MALETVTAVQLSWVNKLQWERQERGKQWQEARIFLKINFHTKESVYETTITHLNFKNVLICVSH